MTIDSLGIEIRHNINTLTRRLTSNPQENSGNANSQYPEENQDGDESVHGSAGGTRVVIILESIDYPASQERLRP